MLFARPFIAASTPVAVLVAVTCSPGYAVADDAPHHVRYTVTAETPTDADIYYRDTDPTDFAAYGHDPYQFSPKADAMVGPGDPWVFDAKLADPDQWAMVVASSAGGHRTPNLQCTLEVDGVIVKTAQGARGALCSLRRW
jgi:hypothetical protein